MIIDNQYFCASIRRSGLCLLLALMIFSLVNPRVVLASNPAPSNVQQSTAIEWGDCMFDNSLIGWQEGQSVQCGYLTVPETYEDPSGPTIRLAVVLIKSTGENPAAEPLVMLQGGPGGSTIETYTQVIAYMAPHLLEYSDIILFDQRGTLYSEPSLVCPEVLDVSVETLNQVMSDEEEYAISMEAMEDCRNRLLEDGVNLDAYDSIENARDVESLRVALGYEQINLYGVSYGSLLAQHVMRLHPEGLRTVVLDSIVPTNRNFITEVPQTQQRSFQAMFEACGQDEACNAAYPNLEQVFTEVKERLNEEPQTVELGDAETGRKYPAIIDGDVFELGIFQMMYATDLIPFMPRIIYDARAGKFDFFSTIYSILVFDRAMSLGMYYTVLCAEDADFSPEDVNVTGLSEEDAESERKEAAFMLQSCTMWGVESLDPVVDEPVVSDIPTLLLSGAFDPITPPENADLVAESLSQDFSVTIPWGGHGAVGSSKCADQILVDFLANPSQQPDTTCINEHRGVEWVTKGSLVTLPVIKQLLNLEGNSGQQLLLYVVALLFLLTGLIIYPIAWLVRRLSRPARPAAVMPDVAEPVQSANPFEEAQQGVYDQSSAPQRRHPLLYRFAPWLSAAAGLLLLVFTALLTGILFSLAMSSNSMILYMGMPGSSRPIFILPILAGLSVLVMLGAALLAWLGKAGSAWGRIYFTLLTLAALVCVSILSVWGMMTALFA